MPAPQDITGFPPEHKRCSRCHEVKPFNAFNKNKKERLGLEPQCKDCYRLRYLASREKNLAQKREYYLANREKILADKQAYHTANRAARAESNKKWREANQEKRRAYLKDNKERISLSRRRYYQENREAQVAQTRQWQKANPERTRLIYRRWEMRKREAFVEDVDLDVLYQRDQGICSLCHRPCKRKDATIDHIQPLTKGGEHSYQNTALAHRSCNSSKGNRVVPQQIRLF